MNGPIIMPMPSRRVQVRNFIDWYRNWRRVNRQWGRREAAASAWRHRGWKLPEPRALDRDLERVGYDVLDYLEGEGRR